MEAAYANAGSLDFAAWIHESDSAMRDDLERRGYSLKESICAMGMPLDDARPVDENLDFVRAGWRDYVGFLEALGFRDLGRILEFAPWSFAPAPKPKRVCCPHG